MLGVAPPCEFWPLPPLPASAGATPSAMTIVLVAMKRRNMLFSFVAAPKGAPSSGARHERYRRGQRKAPPSLEAFVPNATSRAALSSLRRRLLAGNVQQVLDRAHSLDLARLRAEILDQIGLLELASQVDHTVFDIDVDLSLRHVGAAEDLALDLARQRDVVGLGFLLFGEVGRLLLQALGVGGDALRLPAVLTKPLGGSLDRFLAALAAVVGIEEVRECCSKCSCKGESRHQSDSLHRGRVGMALPVGGHAKLSTERRDKLDPRKIRRILRGFNRPSRSPASESRVRRGLPRQRAPRHLLRPAT